MSSVDDLLEPPTTVRIGAAAAAVRSVPRRDAPIPVLRLPGVYRPATDSWLLVHALTGEPLAGQRVLDLCTGSGVVATAAARAGAAVVATDVGRRAVLSARLNLWRSRVRADVRRGDLLDAAAPGDYDLIVSNPPYVPAPTDALPRRGIARAWDAGCDGRAILDRICREAPTRLRPGGRLLLVQSAVAGAERTLELLAAAGMRVEVVGERELVFGPVMRGRERLLRDGGMIASGQRRERLVVIRAIAGER